MNMASNQHGELSGTQIVRLGKEISTQAMESLAEGYLEISDARIKSFKDQRNPGENQVQVSVTKQ